MLAIRYFSTLILVISLPFIFFDISYAQFQIDAEIRPRTELRHGYKTIPAATNDPAFFTEQRSRLSLRYTQPEFQVGISAQDIRIWGSESQLKKSDNLSSVHDAWGAIFFDEHSFVKAGRQELVYDDQRILGLGDVASKPHIIQL